MALDRFWWQSQPVWQTQSDFPDSQRTSPGGILWKACDVGHGRLCLKTCLPL